MRPGLLCFNYSSCQKKKITSILMAGAADRGALVGCWEQVEEERGGGGGGREQKRWRKGSRVSASTPWESLADSPRLVTKTHLIPLSSSPRGTAPLHPGQTIPPAETG